MFSPVRLIQKLFWASDKGFKIASSVAPQKRYIHSIQMWRVTRWPLFLFQAFADIVVVESLLRHVQCAQNPMHPVESAAASGSSQLHSSMNFGSIN